MTNSKIIFPVGGEMQIGSPIGNFIKRFIKENDIQKVLETGAHNGLGSTRILYEALLEKENPSILSFEMMRNRYEEAKELYSSVDWISINHGYIVKLEEYVFDYKENLNSTREGWLQEDIKNYNDSEFYDVSDMEFDLAFLDSSEFCGFAEFKKVENRCKYVVLDDTNDTVIKDLTMKHPTTRRYCLENYKCIIDVPHDRNGWAVFDLSVS